MAKSEKTRHSILDEAVDLASVVGLHGLTIGSLAQHAGLSKSGLFAHFGSKEALQIATLRAGVERFRSHVIQPALEQPRGLLRLEALFENWLQWSAHRGAPGGCLLVAASVELDDQPGPTRDYLADTQRQWLDFLAGAAQRAVQTGELRADLDCEQFAHELNSIFLGFHHAQRLLGDPASKDRARRAFTRLIEDARQHATTS